MAFLDNLKTKWQYECNLQIAFLIKYQDLHILLWNVYYFQVVDFIRGHFIFHFGI